MSGPGTMTAADAARLNLDPAALGQAAALRPSGLIVPAALATVPEAGRPVEARDPDGRRRVVMSADDRRKMDRAIRALRQHGLQFVAVCDNTLRSDRCGQLMRPEGHGTPDPGYGCRCTRVHIGG